MMRGRAGGEPLQPARPSTSRLRASSAFATFTLHEGGLELAGLAVVALVADADARGVVADTAARAIATLGTAVAAKGVLVRRALDLRAISATVADVALAAELLDPVVAASVGGSDAVDLDASISDEAGLRLADAVARAIVGADRCKKERTEKRNGMIAKLRCCKPSQRKGAKELTALASNASVADEAVALAADAIAHAATRALLLLVSAVGITEVEVAALVVG